ncbi:MAG: antibiotic biosynthesis monooxygenase [Bacteroidales bacterium]|nr:antibiotic biosynthesis monooxygenase [Bacteroidales bacterium]
MKTKVIIFLCAAVLAVSCNRGAHSHGQGDGKCCKAETKCSKEEAKCCKSEAKCTEPKKIISARLFIKPEKLAGFLAGTKALIEASRAEEGNVSYSLFQDPEDATKLLFFEEWKNQAAVDAHFATEHFKKFGVDLNEAASQPAEITVYDSVAETKQ